jgi:hypothetical protein
VQTAESKKQTANSRHETAESGQQRLDTDSKEHIVDRDPEESL